MDMIYWANHTFTQCQGSQCSGWNFVIVYGGAALGGWAFARGLLWLFIDRKEKR